MTFQLIPIIIRNCKYVTICSVFILYEMKMVNQKLYEMKMELPPSPPKKSFLSNLEFFGWVWEKTYFLALGMGPNFGPKIG